MSPWSMCSESCGIGFTERVRTCDNPQPRFNGMNCTGSVAEREDCTIAMCPGEGAFIIYVRRGGGWGA